MSLFARDEAILLLFLIPFLIGTFSGTEYIVEPTEPQVYLVKKSWWGLEKKEVPIRWMKTSGYDYPCWMAQRQDGSWYCAVFDFY